MKGPLRDLSPFAKAIAMFAIAFGIGCGLCGLSFVVPSADSEFHTNWLSIPSLLLIILSLFGLAATAIAWMIAGIAGGRSRAPQRLFDHDDENGDQR
jgi:hypothetical protein